MKQLKSAQTQSQGTHVRASKTPLQTVVRQIILFQSEAATIQIIFHSDHLVKIMKNVLTEQNKNNNNKPIFSL